MAAKGEIVYGGKAHPAFKSEDEGGG